MVEVNAACPTGALTVDAAVTAVDTFQGSDASRSFADHKDMWTVQSPPVLALGVTVGNGREPEPCQAAPQPPAL